MHHVIVGSSIAGIEAARALRARAPDAEITVIGDEAPRPFARTALMYVLAGQLRLEDTVFVEAEALAALRLRRLHDRVDTVDVAARHVHLAAGGVLAYDRLLLAVGSRARRLDVPGADLPGVHRFVRLEDLRALDGAARPGARVAVVGGGLVGVEVAEVLHARGLHVHWLVREPSVWPAALDADEGALVAAHVRGHGVDVRTAADLRAITQSAAGLRLELDGAPLEVDLVVECIGVRPRTAFLAGSGMPLGADGGIEVDDHLAVLGVPDVWAAGDCANVTWADGARRPETLWYTARDQGRVAGAAMAGASTPYRRTCWVNAAKFFDVEWCTAGWVPTVEAQRTEPGRWQTWSRAWPHAPASLRIVVRDGRVFGFTALGRRWDTAVWLRWIQDKRPLDWVLAHLDAAGFDEELTPRLPGGA